MSRHRQPKQTSQTAGGEKQSDSWMKAPSWIQSFYAKFPLITFDQEDEIPWKEEDLAESSLWVHAPYDQHPYHRPWASSHPSCLRFQLLFLLRKAPVQFRTWTNEAAAPEADLPALHLLYEEKLVSASGVRGWLDDRYPLKGKNKEIQNMPSQAAYDKGVAVAQIILDTLYTAYLASVPTQPKNFPLLFSTPPPLAAGLKTPLPAAFTGDDRLTDHGEVISRGVDTIHALTSVIDEWALGASSPTPLDALIAAYLYPIYSLPDSNPLRTSAEDNSLLGEYLDRVLSVAGSNVR